MRKTMRPLLLVLIAFLFPAFAGAQAEVFPKPGVENPATASAIAFYTIGKSNIIAGAELMPAADYSFRPTKDVRTFGELVAHIADAQFIFCSAARKQANPNGERLQSGQVTQTLEKSSNLQKDALVAALKKSFAYCDSVFSSNTADASWGEQVTLNAAGRPKSVPIILALIHMWEHYGNMVTYLRLKGLVPPSTDRAQSRR